MANAPVQVVLNTKNFVGARPARKGGGGNKEFLEGEDEKFAEHRRKVHAQLSFVQSLLTDDVIGGIGYAKIRLQRSALAKSHRPTTSLFSPKHTPIVGNEGVGKLLVEVTPESLHEITLLVDSAEANCIPVRDQKTMKEIYKPSRKRSEIGAIDEIPLWGATDKRKFSAHEAVDWLVDEQTGGSYRVELFEMPPISSEWDTIPARKRQLFSTFLDGLRNLGNGVVVLPLEARATRRPVLTVRLSKSSQRAIVQVNNAPRHGGTQKPDPFDSTVKRHESLLQFLDAHPLVRTIEVAPKLTQSIAVTDSQLASGELKVPSKGTGRYPLIGIIDGGVSAIFEPWIVSRWGLLADEDCSEEHGTLIAGILIAGQSTNRPGVVREPDGCNIVDVDILPTEKAFSTYYRKGIADFFDELETAVASLRQQFGVRIFNLSINTTSTVSLNRYSVEASRLDAIAEKHDVLIVVSCGNVSSLNARLEWNTDSTKALADLARNREDRVQVPAETIRNVSVGALNPPEHDSCVAHAPAAYSRRGPGLQAGVKPDVSHVGGSGNNHPKCGSGLQSCRPDGTTAYVQGTSFAAPQVAKTLALLDANIEGDVSRETLLALLVHVARLPAPISDPIFGHVARDLVGFGLPPTAREILLGSESQITLVFSNRLQEGKELNFDFTWPKSLVTESGACRGVVTLTLVSTHPLSTGFGAELVRINIEASLQQEHNGKYESRLNHAYLPSVEVGSSEADLIEHALKWSCTKIYGRNIPKGVGRSSNWRLKASYLTRDQELMPSDGVPFTLILTIADTSQAKPIFNEMRQSLSGLGVAISDIHTAARIVSRI